VIGAAGAFGFAATLALVSGPLMRVYMEVGVQLPRPTQALLGSEGAAAFVAVALAGGNASLGALRGRGWTGRILAAATLILAALASWSLVFPELALMRATWDDVGPAVASLPLLILGGATLAIAAALALGIRARPVAAGAVALLLCPGIVGTTMGVLAMEASRQNAAYEAKYASHRAAVDRVAAIAKEEAVDVVRRQDTGAISRLHLEGKADALARFFARAKLEARESEVRSLGPPRRNSEGLDETVIEVVTPEPEHGQRKEPPR
jgi:hypothetical protein